MMEKFNGDVSKEPYISVIVTAYNRNNFLKQSLESILNQSLPVNQYEVVLVKNFEDNFAEDLEKEGKIICVKSDEKSMGRFISEGIKKSSGEVISFLEDDDTWKQDKLEILHKAFLEDSRLGYFHHSVLPIDSSGRSIKTRRNFEKTALDGKGVPLVIENSFKHKYANRLGKYFPDFNLSSVTVRRKLIMDNYEWLGKMDTAVDSFLFFAALLSNYSLVLSPKDLTNYRRHLENQSGSDEGDLEQYLSTLYQFTKRGLRAYSLLEQWVDEYDSTFVRKIAKRRFLFTRALNAIQSPNIGRKKVLSSMLRLLPYSRVFHLSLNLKAILLCILYLVSPRYARLVLARNM